ncbi:recombinase family protein [Alkalihalophilus marmarensis]|uniref:Site-specific DNA recombinase n=1 Tax=Alkalihalophilus marmarensis DSM 21297 TaxID=1188261 RepID=U6SJ56_9BACI|nr:recombinase family protein [Alkalihalophilus marmarensis]ERN51618.1 hypothetical protein A33I_20000 [Alkalihalophilus marmarensis DSM 21297]
MGIINAVGYIRVSTEEQATDGYSLENQKSVIHTRCKNEGWNLNRTFQDRGKSGSTIEKREGLKELLNYVREYNIDYVLVYKLSRLSRKISDVASIAEHFENLGVKFISIEDKIDTSSVTGKYFLMMAAIFAEMERDNIILQVKGGMEQKARQGEWNGGSPPLGYDLVDKKLLVNRKEAEIIVYIFNEYLKGKGYKAISKELNDKGWKTKKGKNFNGVGIKEILRNPTYRGQIRWAYRKEWNKLDSEYKRKRKYNEELILSKGIHKAIINKAVFEEVQQRIENNPRHTMKRFDGKHLLSGLLRCPDCGYGMSIQIVKRKDKVYEYYSCNQYQTYKRCKANSIAKNKVEEEFLAIFQQAIAKPEIIETMLKSVSKLNNQSTEIEKNLERKKRELKTLKSKESKLFDELLEGNDNYKNTVRIRIQEVTDKIASIELEIKAAMISLERSKDSNFDSNEIMLLFSKVGKVIRLLDKPKQQSLVRKLVTQVKVEGKSIKEVQFSFQKGLDVDNKGDSEESPSANLSFRVQEGMVNLIINS